MLIKVFKQFMENMYYEKVMHGFQNFIVPHKLVFFILCLFFQELSEVSSYENYAGDSSTQGNRMNLPLYLPLQMPYNNHPRMIIKQSNTNTIFILLYMYVDDYIYICNMPHFRCSTYFNPIFIFPWHDLK